MKPAFIIVRDLVVAYDIKRQPVPLLKHIT